MKFRVFWVVLVFAVLSGVAWAEEAQRAPSADLNAGGIRLAENDQPSADRKLPQAGPSDSSNSMAYTRSGWSRYRSQQYQEALRDFQEAILLNSTNASAWFGLGNCRYGLAEYEQAADSFRQYVILRSSAEGHYWLGNSLLKLLRFRDAETEFRKAIDLDRTKPLYYDGLAWSLFKLERYPEAIPVYEKAVSLGGDSVHRCLCLSFCYYRTKNYSQARDLCRKCISLDPNNSDAYFGLGTSLYGLEAYGSAIEAFRKAIQIKPDDPDAHVWLGDGLYQVKSYRQAEREYREVIRLVPTNSYAHLRLGDCFYQSRSYQQAESEYRQAVKLAPRDFPAHSYLGDALFQQRRFAQAADAYQEAIRMKPEDFEGRYWRGVSLMGSMQFAEAVPDLEKAHELKPEDRTAEYDLFFAYLITSQYKKASEIYPVGFGIGAAALLISFGLGAALLLKKSFQVSATETPGLGFTIGWILIFFEGQFACTFVAGLFGLTFASGSLVAGMAAAPVPLLIAALTAFPKQTWGKPFARPHTLPWKSAGAACLALFFVWLGNSGYVKLMAVITHRPAPPPHNLPFIEETIKGRPALAIVAVAMLMPMAEEVLFRGLLFGALQKRLGGGWTILTTAIVFGASHGDFFYFVPLTAIGVVLGWARNRTGSVWVSALVHILNNALALAVT
jgi:tetratricopeptide (TPR) repeat protein/membrane protease YdiL (CAAX protease family)